MAMSIFEVDHPVTIDMMLEVLTSIKAEHGGEIICVNLEHVGDDENPISINSVFYNAGGSVSIW